MLPLPIRRCLALVFALLHLLVPPLATVADARVERDVVRSGHPTVHVEAHGSAKCPRVHPTDCGLCQVVATLAAPTRGEPELPTPARALPAPRETRLGDGAAGRAVLALPRAPPVA